MCRCRPLMLNLILLIAFCGVMNMPVERWRYIEWSGTDGGAALIDEDNDP